MLIKQSRFPIKHMLTIGLLPGFLKIGYYRWRGAKIGKGVKIGIGTVILSKDMEIGNETYIGMFTCIDCARLKIGKRTRIRSFVLIDAHEIIIGNDVTISELSILRTLVPSTQSKLILHDRAHIFPFTMIDPSRKVEIGEESSVGYGTYIFTHSSYKSVLDGYPHEFGEVNIGNRVWLPCEVFITQSVTIGDEAVIGSGSFVSRDIPPGVLAVGKPAKPIKNKEQYIMNHTEQEKFLMLIDMIDEFCQFLQDFADITWQRKESDEYLNWSLISPVKRDSFNIELTYTFSMATDKLISVILMEVPEDLQGKWDKEKKMWFSVSSRRCSEHLDSLGEELREYFKRYGVYFARP
jgi:acetyltransferase-like isoleucine patch superfamily enzyme